MTPTAGMVAPARDSWEEGAMITLRWELALAVVVIAYCLGLLTKLESGRPHIYH